MVDVVNDTMNIPKLLESTSVHPSSFARAAMRLEPLRARRYPDRLGGAIHALNCYFLIGSLNRVRGPLSDFTLIHLMLE